MMIDVHLSVGPRVDTGGDYIKGSCRQKKNYSITTTRQRTFMNLIMNFNTLKLLHMYYADYGEAGIIKTWCEYQFIFNIKLL